jgi:hypothetical protein
LAKENAFALILIDRCIHKPRTTSFHGGQVPHEGSQPAIKNGTANQNFSNGFA